MKSESSERLPREDDRERHQNRSQVVAVYVPRRDLNDNSRPGGPYSQSQGAREFKKAFIRTLQGKGRGLLTQHLYFEPLKEPAKDTVAGKPMPYAEKLEGLLYGGLAWDEFIKEGNEYSLADSDLSALDHAIGQGLIGQLPEKIKIVELGSGGKSGVEKPSRLIQSIMETGARAISSYIAFDKVSRFATESSLEIHEKFNLKSYAVVGDFTARQKTAIPNGMDSVPVVVTFGGSLANAPDSKKSKGRTGKSNAMQYFCQLNRQYGLGSYILLSYHCETDRPKLLKQYGRTGALEAFIMSAFVRAAAEGIITDKDYNTPENWRMEPTYDSRIKAVEECAVCLKDHKLATTEGVFSFKKGDRLPITLSHQWDEKDYAQVLGRAGWEIVENGAYRADNAPRGIILARAVRSPRCR